MSAGNVARTTSVAIDGIAGHVVTVEAHVDKSTPKFNVVGLPDTSLNEAKHRLRSACAMVGQSINDETVTVNLSPAWLPKSGTMFDLAMIVAILGAKGVVEGDLESCVFIGEVGLDGYVRAGRGTLPAVASAVRAGITKVIVAREVEAEAELVDGANVWGVEHLVQVMARFSGGDVTLPDVPARSGVNPSPVSTGARPAALCLSDVAGQADGRAAMEVAAAGGHHVFMVGAPGAGKTMLAERLPTILPPLGDAAAVEVTAIASVLATDEHLTGLIRRPPFVAPHHSASMAALIGGGSSQAVKPGAITAAHRGVLFLDEAPEFSPRVLQALRQPLESGTISIARAKNQVVFPAAFQLLMAANPCPCGQAASPTGQCRCTPQAVSSYLRRLGGPLLDRVDVHVTTQPVTRAQLADSNPAETSAVVAERVLAARGAAAERWSGLGHSWTVNAHVPGQVLRTAVKLPAKDRAFLDAAMDRGRLSARGYDRTLRLSWTLADLAGLSMPTSTQVGYAYQLRSGRHELEESPRRQPSRRSVSKPPGVIRQGARGDGSRQSGSATQAVASRNAEAPEPVLNSAAPVTEDAARAQRMRTR